MAVARKQSGFTLIELMITVAIIGILASLALGQYNDYVRRAKMSEVLLAATNCKTFITEGYLSMSSAPAPNTWGCESETPTSQYTGEVKTSSDGAIRVTIAGLDAELTGRHVYLAPLKPNGTPLAMPADLGAQVHQWLCGSDEAVVRKALPSSCRADTTAQAAGTFE